MLKMYIAIEYTNKYNDYQLINVSVSNLRFGCTFVAELK